MAVMMMKIIGALYADICYRSSPSLGSTEDIVIQISLHNIHIVHALMVSAAPVLDNFY